RTEGRRDRGPDRVRGRTGRDGGRARRRIGGRPAWRGAAGEDDGHDREHGDRAGPPGRTRPPGRARHAPQPGGHDIDRPPSRWKWRWGTVWPPHAPTFVTTR